MTMSQTTAPDAPSAIDPDPFGIGIGIFAAMVSGASFLETRRTNTFMQQQQRAAFRSAWKRVARRRCRPAGIRGGRGVIFDRGRMTLGPLVSRRCMSR